MPTRIGGSTRPCNQRAAPIAAPPRITTVTSAISQRLMSLPFDRGSFALRECVYVVGEQDEHAVIDPNIFLDCQNRYDP